MEDELERMMTFHEDMASPKCAAFQERVVNSTSDAIEEDFANLKTTIVILHYGTIIPFFLIFVYSFLFEITFTKSDEDSQTIEVNQRPNNNSRTVDQRVETPKGLKLLIRIGQAIMAFLVGVFSGFTVSSFVGRKFYEHSLLKLATDKKCQELLLNQISHFWIIFYLIACGVMFVLMIFSHQLLKFREKIVLFFFTKEEKKDKKKDKSIRFSLAGLWNAFRVPKDPATEEKKSEDNKAASEVAEQAGNKEEKTVELEDVVVEQPGTSKPQSEKNSFQDSKGNPKNIPSTNKKPVVPLKPTAKLAVRDKGTRQSRDFFAPDLDSEVETNAETDFFRNMSDTDAGSELDLYSK